MQNEIIIETESESILIREDSDYPKDLLSLLEAIKAQNEIPRKSGGPLFTNLHSGRKASLLSKTNENSSYQGLVTIFIILTILSLIILSLSLTKRKTFEMVMLKIFKLKKYEDLGQMKQIAFSFLLNLQNYMSMPHLFELFLTIHWMISWPIISYLIEKHLAPRAAVPSFVVLILIVLNLSYTLVFPYYHVRRTSINALFGIFMLGGSLAWFFKFWSYHHLWYDLRNQVWKTEGIGKLYEPQIGLSKTWKIINSGNESIIKEKSNLPNSLIEEVVAYPYNIRIKDVGFLWLIPTLCFQLKYPLQERWIFKFFKKFIQFMVLWVIWSIVITRFAYPAVIKTVDHFNKENYSEAISTFLYFSVVHTYILLISFYLGFHCYLNAFAELTGFSDRKFYDDWWNSKTFEEFWKKWNLPMHNWFISHVYLPLRRKQFSQIFSMILVYAFSGIFHEFLLSWLLGKITLAGFNGMMINVPIILIQKIYTKYLSKDANNAIFWILFSVLGLPLGYVLAYYNLSN